MGYLYLFTCKMATLLVTRKKIKFVGNYIKYSLVPHFYSDVLCTQRPLPYLVPFIDISASEHLIVVGYQL